MVERKIFPVYKKCTHCNKPFTAYKGISVKLEDQPCPHCNKTESEE